MNAQLAYLIKTLITGSFVFITAISYPQTTKTTKEFNLAIV
jgi:hypothetical protein